MRRLLKWKRLRWFAIGSLIRFVLRRSAVRSVDRATADLEERLPAPLRRALDAVPADAVRAGGSAVVAGRTARRMAARTRRASQVAGDRRRRMSDGMNRIRSIGQEIGNEAEQKRRELKAEYLRATDRPGDADDALLDVRDGGQIDAMQAATGAEDLRAERGELPQVMAPVRPGRWRAERRLKAAAVNRVQRSYQPPSRRWDR